MAQLAYTHFYLYDAFEKDVASEVIDKITKKFGKGKEESGSMEILDLGKKVQETKNRWEISPQEMLNHVEEICKKENVTSDISLARDSVKKIDFVGIQNEELPYFLLIISISLDESKLNFDNLFKDMNKLLYPFRIYFEEFHGISTKLFRSKPVCPYFVNVGVLSSKEELQEMFQVCKELYEADGIPHESIKIDYAIQRSARLRKIAPLSSMTYGFNLLSIPKLYSNTVVFAGHLEQMGLNGLMTPFILTFSQENYWDTNFGSDPFLIIRPTGYDNLVFPWSSAGTMIYLVSMYAWLLQLERTVANMESEFTRLRKNIRDILSVDKESGLEEQLIDLDKNGSSIADFMAEVGRLTRSNESSLSRFRENSSINFEIPILPSTKSADYYIWSEVKESTGSDTYIHALARKIDEILNRLRATLEQFSHENEKLHSHVNNLVNLRSQKILKRHSRIMMISAFAITGLTVTLVILTLKLITGR